MDEFGAGKVIRLCDVVGKHVDDVNLTKFDELQFTQVHALL